MKRRTLFNSFGVLIATTAGCLENRTEHPRNDNNQANRSNKVTTENQNNSSPTSVVSYFDADPTRPECEIDSETIEVSHNTESRSYETAATKAYPDNPTEFTPDVLLEYVNAFDNAYVTHEILCSGSLSGHILNITHNVQTSERFDWYDEVMIIFLLRAAGASSGLDSDGYLWQADIPIDGVVYAVDETGIARAAYEDVHTVDWDDLESNAPNPLKGGTLVGTFD